MPAVLALSLHELTRELARLAPPAVPLPVLCLLLFADNATLAVLTTPLLFAYAPRFEPWQVGLYGAFSAGAGSTIQLLAMRWIVAPERRWARRFAAQRAGLREALASAPSASFMAILIARATPLPDAPLKLIAAAGGYPLARYFCAVLIGGIPYFALIAWLGHEFPVPTWALALLVLVIALAFMLERWRQRGRRARV